MENYGIGKIEEGTWRGKHFIIPSIVLVENGVFPNGSPQFSKACIKCCKFLSDQEAENHICDNKKE